MQIWILSQHLRNRQLNRRQRDSIDAAIARPDAMNLVARVTIQDFVQDTAASALRIEHIRHARTVNGDQWYLGDVGQLQWTAFVAHV